MLMSTPRTRPEPPAEPEIIERYTREEGEGERLDRKWNDLITELRVMQTGVQLLTGFLLTLPFQSKFADLTSGQVRLYVGLVVMAAVATILMLSVVMMHRSLAGYRIQDHLIAHSDRIVRGTVLLVGVLLLGVCVLIFDLVLGDAWAFGIAIVLVVLVLLAWFAYPTLLRRTATERPGKTGTKPSDQVADLAV